MKVAISSVDLETAIGRRIASLRKSKGMTQRDLAFELDISIKHCSECERGVAMLSIERMVDVCEIFDVSMDYLIRGIPADVDSLNFPTTMVEVFHSKDKQEIALLTEYLNLYGKLRNVKKETGWKKK